MKRIVFLGSKAIGYHCLSFLIEQQQQGKILIQGVIVKSNPALDKGLDITELAKLNNLRQYSSLDEIEPCDILYSVQYHEILKKRHIEQAQLALNLHMAPLPEYRGANQFSYALIEEKKEFGTTIHKMDTRIDHGPIAFEHRFPIPAQCWVQDLYLLTEHASIELFRNTFDTILKNEIKWINQDELIESRGTSLHYKKEIQELKHLDPNWPKEKILKYVRATYMPGFEGPYFIINDKKVFIKPQEHA